MTRKAIGRDLRTSAAMAGATAVLLALYAAALALPVWLAATGLLEWRYALGFDAVVVALLGLEYAALDRAALRASGAVLASAAEEPGLHATLARLAALADVPKPRVAVVESAVPNAFAAGRDPARSTVVVTRGLLVELEPAELEAVLAHELAHVVNRDGAVMTLAGFPALSLGAAIRDAPLKIWILGLPLMALACLAYAVSTALVVTVSRCREYGADRSAALLTGAPEQLMSALQRIAATMPRIPDEDLRRIGAMTAFFIVPARVRSLTHPPLEERLARLGDLARDLGEPDPAGTGRANLVLGLATFSVVFTAVVLAGTVFR